MSRSGLIQIHKQVMHLYLQCQTNVRKLKEFNLHHEAGEMQGAMFAIAKVEHSLLEKISVKPAKKAVKGGK